MSHNNRKKRVYLADTKIPAAIVIRHVIGDLNGGPLAKIRGRKPKQFVRAPDQEIAELGRRLQKRKSK